MAPEASAKEWSPSDVPWAVNGPAIKAMPATPARIAAADGRSLNAAAAAVISARPAENREATLWGVSQG